MKRHAELIEESMGVEGSAQARELFARELLERYDRLGPDRQSPWDEPAMEVLRVKRGRAIYCWPAICGVLRSLWIADEDTKRLPWKVRDHIVTEIFWKREELLEMIELWSLKRLVHQHHESWAQVPANLKMVHTPSQWRMWQLMDKHELPDDEECLITELDGRMRS